MSTSTYILVTAAYNEEKNIEKTITSVVSQSILPYEWIIVSDGSTDTTDQIIKSFVKKYKFIKYLRIPGENKHSFASKVFALQAGIEKLARKKYDYIGILDADVSFMNNYFEEILKRFVANPRLGIAGGNIIEYLNGQYLKRIKSLNSVAGAVQLYRKSCFVETGPFLPLEYGGEDAVKEIIARMKGWEVRTIPDIEVIHHGFVGGKNSYRNRYRTGIQHNLIGYHPVFYFFRCLLRLKERPVVIGSIVELFGFLNASIKYKEKKLPGDVVAFLRAEQMKRLKGLIRFSKVTTIKDQITY